MMHADRNGSSIRTKFEALTPRASKYYTKSILSRRCFPVKKIRVRKNTKGVRVQYILDSRIKRMKEMASSDKVELPHNNLMRGGHILHEQAYNTGHGISAIPDAIRGKIWCEPSRPEVQQEPVVHLLLEDPLGRDGAVPGLPVQTPAQPSQSAHGGGAEADPGYAPP